MKSFRAVCSSRLPVVTAFIAALIFAFAGAWPASAAPIVTATKDDNLAAGLRKLPGNTITYTITIGNSGDATATAVQFTDPDPANTTFVSVNSTPIARNDAYNTIGNVQINVAAPGLLANDSDPDGVGPALTVTAVNTAGTQGSVTFNANGSFTFNPLLGFNGATTFTYTMSDGEGNTDTATATITVAGRIWFINAAAGAGGDGRLTTPFNSIAAFNSTAADVAGDNVFFYSGTYTTPPTLLANERLIGQGATASITTITGLAVPSGNAVLPATGGARPTIAVTSGTGITLVSGNTINGLNVTNSNGSGITGGAVGTLTLADFDVTVTGGTALSLTTSGTVTATGSDNDLNSTNGTALNVNAVNIGAVGLTFKSISAGAGANNGINLVSTGASGGLTVTGLDGADPGTDADPGTGGTIAGKTGADGSTTSGIGIFLSDTRNVSLAGMQLNDHQNFAVRGTSVTGFTLAASILNGTHGVGAVAANDEGAISFTNLLGSAAITNSTVANTNAAGGAEAVLRVVNNSGTLDRLTISGSTISNSNAVPGIGDDGMYFESQNSAVMKLTINNSHFTASRADLIQTNALNSSTMDIVVTGTEFKNSNSAILSGGGGTTFSGGGTGSTATVTFNISGNTFRDSRGHAINVFKGTGTANFSGTISNNTVGVAGVANSGTRDSAGDISAESLGAGTMTVLISGNILRQYNEEGIRLFANTGSSVLNATVIGNTVTEPGTLGAFGGVYAGVGGVPGDTCRINLLLGSFGTPANQNSLVGSDPSGFNDVYLDNQSATTTFNLSRGGSAAGTVAGVVQDDNVGSPTVVTSGTITLVAGNPPLPLLFAPGGVERALPDVESTQTTLEEALPGGVPVLPDGRETTGNAKAPCASLSQPQLDCIVSAALARWTATGLSADQLATLRGLKFEVADLPGWYLGEAGGERIRVDTDAGGNGWFVDASAASDAQFAVAAAPPPQTVSAAPSPQDGQPRGEAPREQSAAGAPQPLRRYADPAGAPAGRIDLLTAILHEMGHALGLCDTYAEQDRDRLMYGFLTKGERRLPTTRDAASAAVLGGAPHPHPHFLGTPLTIGDLPPGKTVTITYVVTINAGTTAISTSSQGTVSGGNIASVLTDDPTVAGAANPTVTPIHQPPVVSNVAVATNEDTTLVFAAANFTGSFGDPNGDSLAGVRITSLPANGVLKLGAATIGSVPTDVAIGSIGTLTFVPAADFNGVTSFGWNGSDGTLFAVAGASVNITVNAVNDKPTFIAANPPAVSEDAGAQSVVGWATFNAGAANESGQAVLAYAVSSVSNAAIFSAGPSIAANGTLTYTPAANANGTSTFQVRVQDNGGTALGGIDTSDPQTFTITVNAVNDAPVITGQFAVSTVEATVRTIVLADLIVTDSDNTYPTGFSLTVQNGANYTRVGNAITPALGFVGTLSVPVQVNDGAANSNLFNLAMTVDPTPARAAVSGSIVPEPGGGFRIGFLGSPGVNYTIQFATIFPLSPAPIAWQFLGTRTADANGRYSIVDIPPANTPMRFYRSVLPYRNNFNTGLGTATLRGTAVLSAGAVKLTDEVTGGSGAVTFDGIVAAPSLSGFTARFSLALGPISSGVPADGASFAVGDLGIGVWGESGPATAQNLAVGFDTFSNGPANDNIGIHVWVNGAHLTVNATDPYTGGALVPVEISYDVLNGLTVRYNGATIFNNLAVPGFAFPVGGKFGVGARTGGFSERAAVDDVEITPR